MKRNILSLTLILCLILSFTVVANAVRDKVKVSDKNLKGEAPEEFPITIYAGTYNLSDTNSMTYSDGTLYSEFDVTLDDNFFGSSVTGDSRAAWTGLDPYNCDSIRLTDTIKLTGISVSINVGSSWGVTGGITSKTATWSKEYSDEFSIDHTFQDITFDGVDLYYRQTATGDFSFGTDNFTTTATDTVWP
ncbi:MAG: hypothetical protein KAX49_10930 [Halanaerobiales bacterium]|nr:hypothetical protein [Halanaerobiales bacterium]